MKKLLLLCALLVSVPAMAQGNKSVTLGWDAPSANDLMNIKSTRIYSSGVMIAEATCTPGTPNVCPVTVTFTVTIPGTYAFTARFWDGIQESGDSNTVTTPVGPPGKLHK